MKKIIYIIAMMLLMVACVQPMLARCEGHDSEQEVQDTLWHGLFLDIYHAASTYQLTHDKYALESFLDLLNEVDPQNSSRGVTVNKVWFLSMLHRFEEADSIVNALDSNFFNYYSRYDDQLIRGKLKAQIALTKGQEDLADRLVHSNFQLLSKYVSENNESITDYIKSATNDYNAQFPAETAWMLKQYYCYYSLIHGKDATYSELDKLYKEYPKSDYLINRLKEIVGEYDLLSDMPY